MAARSNRRESIEGRRASMQSTSAQADENEPARHFAETRAKLSVLRNLCQPAALRSSYPELEAISRLSATLTVSSNGGRRSSQIQLLGALKGLCGINGSR